MSSLEFALGNIPSADPELRAKEVSEIRRRARLATLARGKQDERAYFAAKQAEFYAKRRLAGVCTRCGDGKLKTKTLCAGCAVKAAENSRRVRARRLEKAAVNDKIGGRA